MEAFNQLKNLWEKVQNTKKISNLVSCFEDMTSIIYENNINQFSSAVRLFGEAEAFELSDLYDWYEDFTDFYNYIEDNRLTIE